MLSNELRAELDKLWDEFWPATEVKPLAVIDFINSVFLLRFLQAEDERKEHAARFSNSTWVSIFGEDQQRFKWSILQHLDKNQLYQLFNRPDHTALQFARASEEYKKWPKYLEDEAPLVAVPEILFATVKLISRLDLADVATRDELNKYLLQKMEEQKQPTSKVLALDSSAMDEKQRRPLSKTWNVAIVLLAIFISGFTFAYFYAASKNKLAASSAINKPTTDSAIIPLQADSKVKGIGSETRSSTKSRNAKQSNTTSKSKTGKVKQKSTASQKNTPGEEVKGKYKIVSKAYFHNQPDESTRRNAFVVHWNNAYATLNALDEENGFVYVVFKNDQNQTSKGWLRKKDLKPVD